MKNSLIFPFLVFVPSSELNSSIEPTPENQGKKLQFPDFQIQEFESTFENEVIVSHPPLQTESEL